MSMPTGRYNHRLRIAIMQSRFRTQAGLVIYLRAGGHGINEADLSKTLNGLIVVSKKRRKLIAKALHVREDVLWPVTRKT